MKIDKALKNVINTVPHQIYSERAVVMKTYRRADVDTFEYSASKHLTCDVRLIRDGSMVYDVKLTPHILQQGDIVHEAGLVEGNVKVAVPKIGSYVYITWLNDASAFVNIMTDVDSFVIGSNQSYIDVYNKDLDTIIDLVNVSALNIAIGSNGSLSLKVDTGVMIFELIADIIKLIAGNSKLLLENGNINLIVGNTGKVSINNGTENLKDILDSIIKNIEDYYNSVSAGLTAAGYPIPPSVFQDINTIKTNISKLFI